MVVLAVGCGLSLAAAPDPPEVSEATATTIAAAPAPPEPIEPVLDALVPPRPPVAPPLFAGDAHALRIADELHRLSLAMVRESRSFIAACRGIITASFDDAGVSAARRVASAWYDFAATAHRLAADVTLPSASARLAVYDGGQLSTLGDLLADLAWRTEALGIVGKPVDDDIIDQFIGVCDTLGEHSSEVTAVGVLAAAHWREAVSSDP